MTDLSITAASVISQANASIQSGIAAEDLVAGYAVYKDATNANKITRCRANVMASEAACVGICLSAAAAGQPIEYISSGDLNPGGTVTVGQIYIVSSTRGGIAPVSDLATGWFTTILGIGTTTSNIRVAINAGGVAKAA